MKCVFSECQEFLGVDEALTVTSSLTFSIQAEELIEFIHDFVCPLVE